jgi:hypothetical protein
MLEAIVMDCTALLFWQLSTISWTLKRLNETVQLMRERLDGLEHDMLRSLDNMDTRLWSIDRKLGPPPPDSDY